MGTGPTRRVPRQGAGKTTERALGHGVLQVISLLLQLLLALCAHPTELQLRKWGRLQHPLGWSRISPFAFPRETDENPNSVKFHCQVH